MKILFVGAILSLLKDYLLMSECFDKLSMTIMKGSSNKKIITKIGTEIGEELLFLLFKINKVPTEIIITFERNNKI